MQILLKKQSSNLQAGHTWYPNPKGLKNRCVQTKISCLKKRPKAYVVFGLYHSLNGTAFITFDHVGWGLGFC